MNKIKILKAPDISKPFAIIDKPAGLPSAPLTTEDKDNALYQAMELLPALANVCGKKEIEHGLLHRLDTATSGLLIIASTQECYDFLQNEQKEGKIIKKYKAVCDIKQTKLTGFPELPQAIQNIIKTDLKKDVCFTVSSYFRPFGPGRKEVRPVTENDSRAALEKLGKPVLYTTKIIIVDFIKASNKVVVECQITNGYRHQVRCHLAWCGLPVEGDIIYNGAFKNKSAETMKFCASSLAFEYPRGDLNSYDRKDTWT